MVKTPVLIPAYNEGLNLFTTLDSLPANKTDPIVIFNGENNIDPDTLTHFGVKHYEYDEPGKLPSIQKTLRALGNIARDPLLILDADTQPIFPRHWHEIMTTPLLSHDGPAYTAGPLIYEKRENAEPAEAAALTVVRWIDGALKSKKALAEGNGAFFGPSQGIKLSTEESLDAVLSLPHYWPKEDVAMAHAIIRSHGGKMFQVSNPLASVRTPVSPTAPPLHEWVTKGPRRLDAEITERYRASAPAGSMPYD